MLFIFSQFFPSRKKRQRDIALGWVGHWVRGNRATFHIFLHFHPAATAMINQSTKVAVVKRKMGRETAGNNDNCHNYETNQRPGNGAFETKGSHFQVQERRALNKNKNKNKESSTTFFSNPNSNLVLTCPILKVSFETVWGFITQKRCPEEEIRLCRQGTHSSWYFRTCSRFLRLFVRTWKIMTVGSFDLCLRL